MRIESMEVVFQKNTAGRRFAFIVSTKVDKRAVVRNRIKRLIREIVYNELSRLAENMDVVVVVKAKTSDTYDTLKPALMNLFHKAGIMHL